MLSYISRRALLIILVFFIIISVVFLLYRLAPGDPTSMIVSPKLSPEDRQRMRESFGLDKPLHVQYVRFLNRVAHLNFGNSLTSGRPVIDIISERIGPTLLLFLPANILGFIIGIKIGEIMAWIRGTLLEKFLTLFSLSCYTVFFPWLGVILLWIFSYQFGIFPIGGMISPDLWAHGHAGIFKKIIDILWHLSLPLVTLIVVRFAGPALVMRSSMLENLKTEYVKVARAKGLKEKEVRYHAKRNSLLPLITSFGLSIGYVAFGSVIVETVFSWPGIGQVFVQAAVQQDYMVVQASAVMMALLVSFANLSADIAYGFFDPRITYD